MCLRPHCLASAALLASLSAACERQPSVALANAPAHAASSAPRPAFAPPQPPPVAAGAPTPNAADAATPTATLELKARCEPGSSEPSSIDVAFTLALDGRPLFRLDDRVFGSAGMEKLISEAEASDQSGPLPLARSLIKDADGSEYLELKGGRPAAGPVTLRYRARSVPAAEDGARFGLRHDATGIGGSGAYFILLPEPSRVYRTRIQWARPACPPSRDGDPRGEITAMTSFGSGWEPVEITGPLAKLHVTSFFLGRPKTAPVDEGPMHVRSAWFGDPAFDPAVVAPWAARVFAAERALFADTDATPYSIFVRVLPVMEDRSNGIGQPGSFLSAVGPRTTFGPRLRRNIAHEMLHRWIGLTLRLAGPDGSNFWFTEGFTVHYARALTFRAGLISADEFLSDLNDTLSRHFTNPHASATNDEIRRGFFDNEALSVVPYTRGSLYAAELDASIRRASGGSRSLDDMIRELHRMTLTMPENDIGMRELPEAAFRDAVSRELGKAGTDRFDAVIARGAMPEPASEAFGPCFKREPQTYTLSTSPSTKREGFRWTRVPKIPDDQCAKSASL